MKDVNLAIIMGNLTRDPELRYTPNGQPVASLGVATNRTWNDQNGEKREEVEFHDVVVWGKLAELCSQYLGKGRKVHIMGRLQTRSWEAQDGSKKKKTEIVANDVVFVDRPGDGQTSGSTSQEKPKKEEKKKNKTKSKKKDESKKGDNDNDEEEISIDDIPF